ncbi:MAG: transposase [Verrucomicrobiae bacterium]|nr:transposase [Verrucomicrobiae bacterium]
MRKARWLAEWRKCSGKPVLYHVISRVVDRRFVLGTEEKEKFRTLMRMQENFTGCRVLSYCLMDNHFHLLLEVPPMAEVGISDKQLLKRLSAIYGEAFVAGVAQELADARSATYTSDSGMNEAVSAIHKRFTYRMQDLAEFMKGLLQRFTQWFNRAHSRSGTLWEDRFKSVIVEDGVAARTISAYIDLNPLRAGMVKDPAEYRWSSYGEAIGGGKKGNGKKAREGLVRAYFCDQGVGYDAGKWSEVSRLYRRMMGLAIGRKPGRAEDSQSSKDIGQTTQNTAELLESKDNETALKDLGTAKMLRCRIRYFTAGTVIGSKEFVNEAFSSARERFGPKRRDGARRMRGTASAAAGCLWSLRDLRAGVT